MADTWDDGSDDDWDNDDDDQLDAKLGLKKVEQALPTFDDEEDLALKEKDEHDKLNAVELKKKGNAMKDKKREQHERDEEVELARIAMEMEAEEESAMSPDELRALKRRQIEDADNALTDDLFGSVDTMIGKGSGTAVAAAAVGAGDKVVMKDIKDHLKHARKVAECIRGHGKIHLAKAFLIETIQQCKEQLDDDAITEIIKTCNVIKNEKVQDNKRKVKGQAQKSKKVDKAAEAKARKLQVETFGDNDDYDAYDAVGHDYEDAFF
jgi:translation initiation factor 3 subunit J